MYRKEWDDLGDRIQDMIETAVNSSDFKKLSQSINDVLGQALDKVQDAVQGENTAKKESGKNRQSTIQPIRTANLYARLTGERIQSILQTVFGGLLAGGMGTGLFVFLLAGSLVGGGMLALSVPALFLLFGTVAGAVLLILGVRGLSRLSRFKQYVRFLGKNTYGEFEDLSRALGKHIKFVKKDIRGMIARGWFLEGHIDKQETCLITSNDTYRQYIKAQEALEQRQREAEQAKKAAKERNEEEGRLSGQVREVLEKGEEYIARIRQSNDAIPGEEISRKISRMETIVRQIFKRVREHPEIVPDLKRLMDYYLPMTIKLLDAYEEMDAQPVQGENITSSKKEIEAAIDTLNEAFAKLLDSVFKDTAWDVSSDISVLHTMLAQEGLTKDDFTLS